MGHEVIGADLQRSLNLRAEAGNRLRANGGIDGGEVNEVAVVHGQRPEIVLLPHLLHGADVRGVADTAPPHARTRREDLKGIGAEFDCFQCAFF
jgi:hypothetical protein